MLECGAEMQDELKKATLWQSLGWSLIALVMFTLGGLGLGVDAYFLWFAEPQPQTVAQTWDRAAAEILDYRMAVRMGYGRAHRGTSADKLEVRYAYVVDGVRYVSTEAGWYRHSDIAPFKEPRNPHLGSFDCYVNPQNPAESVLFCNTSAQSRVLGLVTMALLALCTGGGAYLLYGCLCDWRRRWRGFDAHMAAYRCAEAWVRRCKGGRMR